MRQAKGEGEAHKSGCLDFHLVGLDCCFGGVVGVLVNQKLMSTLYYPLGCRVILLWS